jgi:hypothetical protein
VKPSIWEIPNEQGEATMEKTIEDINKITKTDPRFLVANLTFAPDGIFLNTTHELDLSRYDFDSPGFIESSTIGVYNCPIMLGNKKVGLLTIKFYKYLNGEIMFEVVKCVAPHGALVDGLGRPYTAIDDPRWHIGRVLPFPSVKKDIKLVNLTPFVVDIDTSNMVLTIPPSGVIANTEGIRNVIGKVNGIPIRESIGETFFGLPEEINGTMLIVNKAIAMKLKGKRDDILVVGKLKYDDEGKPMGYDGFDVV